MIQYGWEGVKSGQVLQDKADLMVLGRLISAVGGLLKTQQSPYIFWPLHMH